MAQYEESKLDEIKTIVSEMAADFRVFRTAIMGDDEGENPQGRLPRLELTVANHGRRITRIERAGLMVVGAALLLKCLAIGADSIAHIVEVFRR